MAIKALAEAVILQSLEDYWDPMHKRQSVNFFKGEGFDVCAELAELDPYKQIEIIYLLGGGRHDKLNRICRHERPQV